MGGADRMVDALASTHRAWASEPTRLTNSFTHWMINSRASGVIFTSFGM